MDYQSIITSNYDYFDQSNICNDVLRSIGWAIVKFLTWLCDGAQNVFDAAYNMLNFTSSELYKNYLSEFSVLITAILTVSFICIAFVLMFSEKKPPVLKNVLIALAVIYVLPVTVEKMNEGLIGAKNSLVTGSYTTQAVLGNITDLNYVAKNGFNFGSTVEDTLSGNSLALQAVDATAHLKPSSYDTDQAKQVFGHYITIDDSGNTEWKEFESKGMFDIFDPPYYYRYKVHFVQIYLLQLANIFVFLFGGYAVVRMIYEIATGRIIAALSSIELSSGQKTRKVLEGIFNGYVVLFGIPVLLKMYLIWQQYVNENNSNGLIRTFLIVFAAFIVVDGPSMIEKLFGYDMGMSLGSQKIMAFMRTVQQVKMHHNLSSRNNSSHGGSTLSKVLSAAKSGYKNSSGATAEPNINSSTSNAGNSGIGFSSVSSVKEPNLNKSTSSQAIKQANNKLGNNANMQNSNASTYSGNMTGGIDNESSNHEFTSTGAADEPTMENTMHNTDMGMMESNSGGNLNSAFSSGSTTPEPNIMTESNSAMSNNSSFNNGEGSISNQHADIKTDSNANSVVNKTDSGSIGAAIKSDGSINEPNMATKNDTVTNRNEPGKSLDKFGDTSLSKGTIPDLKNETVSGINKGNVSVNDVNTSDHINALSTHSYNNQNMNGEKFGHTINEINNSIPNDRMLGRRYNIRTFKHNDNDGKE